MGLPISYLNMLSHRDKSVVFVLDGLFGQSAPVDRRFRGFEGAFFAFQTRRVEGPGNAAGRLSGIVCQDLSLRVVSSGMGRADGPEAVAREFGG